MTTELSIRKRRDGKNTSVHTGTYSPERLNHDAEPRRRHCRFLFFRRYNPQKQSVFYFERHASSASDPKHHTAAVPTVTRYATRQLFGIDVSASICVDPRAVRIGSDPRRSPARRSFVYSQRRETDVVDSDSGSGLGSDPVAVLFSDVLVI